jgi:hypothetical protein
MKRLIITLILLQTIYLFGQKKLGGTFCHKKNYYGQSCLTFKSDSLFNHETKGCRSSGNGRGKYKIIKDTLSLTFLETDTAKNSVVIERINCENIDTLTLYLNVKALETKLPISYADVWLSKGNKVSKLYQLNQNGNLIMKLPKSKIESELTLNIKIAMHKEMTFKVNTDYCSNINIVLETSYVSYQEEGTIWKYKILRQSKNKLVVRGKNNYTYKYKKQNN